MPPFELSIIPIPAYSPSSKPISLPARLSPEVTQVESGSIPLEATLVHAPPTTPLIPPERPFEVMPTDSSIRFLKGLNGKDLRQSTKFRQCSCFVSPSRRLPCFCRSALVMLASVLRFGLFSFRQSSVSKTVPTHSCNLWSEYKVIDSTQIGSRTLGNDFMHRLQSAQQTHRPSPLVLDPGGLAPGLASLEDSHQLKQQDTRSLRIVPTCYVAVTTHSSQQIPPFPVLKPRSLFFV